MQSGKELPSPSLATTAEGLLTKAFDGPARLGQAGFGQKGGVEKRERETPKVKEIEKLLNHERSSSLMQVQVSLKIEMCGNGQSFGDGTADSRGRSASHARGIQASTEAPRR